MQVQCPVRLKGLPVGVKLLLTAFVLLMGGGYLASLGNIYLQHSDADLRPGLGLDDLKRTYHGLDRKADSAVDIAPVSHMLRVLEPGGKMRKYLEKAGEECVRVLPHWLESGATETDFTREGLVQPDDPSPQDVIDEACARCHNGSGEKSDVPFAADPDSLPAYELVAKQALATEEASSPAGGAGRLPPMSLSQLVQMTHIHVLTIPVFALLIAGLFLLTGPGFFRKAPGTWERRLKAVIVPLPMLAICLDIASWWLARPFAPFVHVIGAAGAVFGAALAAQMLCVLGSLWLGCPGAPERTDG